MPAGSLKAGAGPRRTACIGANHPGRNFRRTWEKDPDLNRRFQHGGEIREPSREVSVEILRGLKER